MLHFLRARDLDATLRVPFDSVEVLRVELRGLSLGAALTALPAIDALARAQPSAALSFAFGGGRVDELFGHHYAACGRTIVAPDVEAELTVDFRARREARSVARISLRRHRSAIFGVAGNFCEAIRRLGVDVDDAPVRLRLAPALAVESVRRRRRGPALGPFVLRTARRGFAPPLRRLAASLAGDCPLVEAAAVALPADPLALAAFVDDAALVVGESTDLLRLGAALGVPCVAIERRGQALLTAPPAAFVVERAERRDAADDVVLSHPPGELRAAVLAAQVRWWAREKLVALGGALP